MSSENVSLDRLRRAEIALRSGNWELDLNTGKIFGSEGAMMLYGLDRNEFDYEVVKDIPLPEFRPLLDKALKDLIEGRNPYDIVFKVRNRKSGEIIHIHSTADYDKDGNKVFGVIRDITRQKETEELIRRKNRDLGILLEVTMQLLESTERREIFTNLLQAANRIVGFDTGAVYTVNDRNLNLVTTLPPLPEDFPEEFRRARLENHPNIAKAIDSGSPRIIDDAASIELTPEENLIITMRDMRTLLFIPMIASRQNLGILILGTIGRLHSIEEYEIFICRTISNIASLALENEQLIRSLKSALLKAEESDQLKTAFLNNISHEIRTPLNAIVGFSGLLDQPGLDESERKKMIDVIFQSNNQLLGIINDILNISRIETGQVEISEKPTDIRRLLEDLYNQHLDDSVSKGIDLKLELNADNAHNCCVLADHLKLKQVISNLVGNAIKFTRAGQVILSCSRENEKMVFRVKDTGIGIPQAEHRNIFKRFYQVEKGIAREFPGAGLGLSIAEAYVKLMGGTITVDSEPGLGSVFTVIIPCRMTAYTTG